MCFNCVLGVLGSETGKQDRVEKQGDVVEGGFCLLGDTVSVRRNVEKQVLANAADTAGLAVLLILKSHTIQQGLLYC